MQSRTFSEPLVCAATGIVLGPGNKVGDTFGDFAVEINAVIRGLLCNLERKFGTYAPAKAHFSGILV